ncbi:MAG: ParB/RepB/Spo0J family partition protein [Pseudomonadota bacterium]
MKALTPLAVENRALLEYLEAHGAPRSVEEFARILERDPSNVRKTLKRLEGEGWLSLDKAPDKPPVQLTEDGLQALAGMHVVEGRLKAGLPPLVHAQITPDPNQPRKDFDTPEAKEALAELADNIGERGLLQPVLIRLTGPDTATLVAGERRWRAIGQLIAAEDPRWPADRPIPYHVSAAADEAEILADQVVENLQRKGLHPLEEGIAFKQLKDVHGWGVGQISKAVGRTRRFVEQRLDLLNLPPELQARMQLSKDDPRHLTIPRAREMLQHLRQINEKAGEQRDIEEIAPGASLAGVSEEDLEAARKTKLDAADLLALGEIAAAAAQAPSENFPDSPLPVAEIDFNGAMINSRVGARLQSAKLATFLLDAEATPERAGARVEALGHIRLRQENLHPADNPRALFHLRRDAGISADQARQLGNLGRWATPWLNPTPAKVEATAIQPEPPISYLARYSQPFQGAGADLAFGASKLSDWWPAAEQLMALEVADKILREPGVVIGESEGWTEISRIPDRAERGQLSGVLDFATDENGRCLAKLHFNAGSASTGGGVHGALTRLGFYRDRQEALRLARVAAGALDPDDYAEGEYLYDWLNLSSDPRPAEEAAPVAVSDPEQPQRNLYPAHVRILREVAHALAANDGQPVPVFRYWLDANAVELWKWEPAALLEFRAEPGEAWTVDLTPAGREALDVINEEFDPGVVAMWVAQGGYKTAWLTAAAEEAGEPKPEGLPPEESPFEPTPIRDEVLDALRSGTPDFARLLALAGLQGPFECKVDGTVTGANQAEAGTVDPWRNLTDDVADARAALVAYALNVLAGHVTPPTPPPANELQAELHRTGRALLDVLALRIPPATPLFFEVGHAYEPFAKALNASAWAAGKAEAETADEPLLAFHAGDVVTKGGAMTWRLLEAIAKPGKRAHAFKAQPILHGKDHGKPTTVSLLDIRALVEEAN